MNKTGLVAGAVALLLIAGGAIILSMNNKSQNINGSAPDAVKTQETDTKPQPDSTNETDQQQTPQSDNTISYTNQGFSQNKLTVKAGSTVTVTNNSSRVLQFDSDPHPEHTDNPELNIGIISPGQSKSVTVTKTGTHGFHNHANDNHTGTLIVE